MTTGPTPFEVHESGALLHGTKADLRVGDLLEPGRSSNFGGGRTAGHVYAEHCSYALRTIDVASSGDSSKRMAHAAIAS